MARARYLVCDDCLGRFRTDCGETLCCAPCCRTWKLFQRHHADGSGLPERDNGAPAKCSVVSVRFRFPGRKEPSFPVPRELLFLYSISSKSVLTSNGTKTELLPQRRGPGNHIPVTSSRVSPLSERPERLVNCQVPQNCWPLTQPRKYR